jgi:hypothetical protein
MIKELLPEIWKNKSKITEGIKNLAFKKEHIEDLAKYRKSICETCIWFNKNQKNKPFTEIPEVIRKLKDKKWIEDIVESNNDKCIDCGCGLGEQSIKLRCTSCSCGLNLWKSVTSVEEQVEINKIIENE